VLPQCSVPRPVTPGELGLPYVLLRLADGRQLLFGAADDLSGVLAG